ncbi:AAA family ATPase [Staphylococcus aureus]|nr:AAA family ATPase [Staphylococcus aureus]MVJ15293.1 AAA family ATPase [Staphylococcus aureus]HDH1882711.1 AAA family ATPase [Staphylococcus aureus]HDH2406590.1 AAA family ATPase [Staphylococcus aureus]
MKINKLTISNFAGIKEEKFNFDGKDAKIYGNNATGKTTTATALQWLLFDKGLDGSTKSFNPVPLNEKNEENYELIPTVFAEFEIDGKITTFKKESHPKYTINQKTNHKEYSRSRTKKQYINDESIKVKDYKARIDELIDEDVFKLITNPQAFNLLDWKKRRSLLFEIAKPINDEDVIKTNDDFKELNNILGDHEIETKKKILTDKIKQINKDIKDIPIRINQTQQNKQDVPEFDNDRYAIIKQEIEQLENERIDIQNGKEEINLRNQLADKQSELKRIEDNNSASNENKIHALTNELHVENGTVANLKTRLKQNKQQITHEENRRNQLLENHKGLKSDLEKAKNQKFEYLDDNVCSCCGQKLPVEQVDMAREKALQKFNASKSKELETIQTSINHIISEGKKIKLIIEKLEDDNNNLQIKINEAEERSARIQNKINKLKTTHVDVTQTDEYKAVMLEINEINQKRSNIRKTIQDKVSGIDDKISELTQEKSEIEVSRSIEKSNKHLDDVISELRNEEDRLLDEKEKYSHDLYILKEFTTTKVKMLTENINNEFEIAEFKLFNTLVNGELEETCSTTVNGVEYDSGLNNASRINVGLDIINTLSKHFKVTAPIFIDNAESVTELIKTESQQIQLIVNEQDKKLRMETI